jgi:starvation-inducible DNA-binding protein
MPAIAKPDREGAQTMKRNPHQQAKQALARGLTGLLADTYLLYNTTQVCHWNVDGPQFAALHDLFEAQYREMADAIDMIAERIRALGFYASGQLHAVLENSGLGQRGRAGGADEMLRHLIDGHEQTVERLRDLVGLAEAAMDDASDDLVVTRLRVHEKTLWMLRSQAGEPSRHLGEKLAAAASPAN